MLFSILIAKSFNSLVVLVVLYLSMRMKIRMNGTDLGIHLSGELAIFSGCMMLGSGIVTE